MKYRDTTTSLWRVAAPMLFCLGLAGCGVGDSDSSEAPTPTATALASGSTVPADRRPCEDGRLLIADLLHVDQALAEGLQQTAEIAADWQSDARLVEFHVNCTLFDVGFRWQGVYFSDSSQLLFTSDTQETTPTNVDPEIVTTLSLDGVSYDRLHESLIKAGFTEDLEIGASGGVDLRMNTAQLPFGPDAAPEDTALFYLSILRLGEVKDLFVDTQDGTVYRETVGE